MLETLETLAAAFGVLGAIIAAVAALAQIRADRSDDWTAGGGGWFARLARPAPALIGAALLALVSVLLLSSDSDEDERPSDPASLRLLRELVDEDARDCRERAPADGATAAMSCSFPDRPMRSLRITLFPSAEALVAAEQASIESAGLEQGECAGGRDGWQRWRRGVLVCDYGDGRFPPHLEWSRRDSRVLVEAQALEGTSGRLVYDWWLKESNGAPAGNESPYPDRAERALLDRAELAEEACNRVSTFKGSSAALRCSVPGVDTLFLARHDSPAALRQALGDPPGEGSCVPVDEGPEPGRRRYEIGGRPAGTRDCHSLATDDASVVEWTNEATRVYGYASVRGTAGADLARVFGWWEETGRLLTD